MVKYFLPDFGQKCVPYGLRAVFVPVSKKYVLYVFICIQNVFAYNALMFFPL